jgi:hypothetical protein
MFPTPTDSARSVPGRVLRLVPSSRPWSVPLAEAGRVVPPGPRWWVAALVRIAELYQLVFPDDPTLIQPLRLAEEEVSRLLEAFLGRVDQEYFPVYAQVLDWYGEEEAFIHWSLDVIPVALQGFQVGYAQPSEYRQPVSLLLQLAEWQWEGRVPWVDLEAAYSEMAPLPTLPLGEAHQRLAGMDLPAPLIGLPDLIRMVLQDTGNWWLDWSQEAYSEGGMEYAWEAGTVQALQAEWHQAQPILERVRQLLRWAEAEPDGGVRAVLECLHRAQRCQPGVDESSLKEAT